MIRLPPGCLRWGALRVRRGGSGPCGCPTFSSHFVCMTERRNLQASIHVAQIAADARPRRDCGLTRNGTGASGPTAGEKGFDDALLLGFYLVRTVELIVAARGFSRCTRHEDAPRLACTFDT